MRRSSRRPRILHEGEETSLPRHRLEDDGLDLEPHLPLQLAPRQAPGLHEQLAESLAVRSALLRDPGSLQIALGDLPRAHQHPAERMRVRANRRGHDAPGLEAHHALVVAQRRRDAERPGLSAQIEELKDVVYAAPAERALIAIRQPALAPQDAVEIGGGTRVTPRAARILARRLEVHDATPSVDRLAEPMLVRGEHSLEVHRADVLGIEAKHAPESDGRVPAAAALVQRLPERRERIEVVRIALQELDEEHERFLVTLEASAKRCKRERGLGVGRNRIQRRGKLAFGLGVEPLHLEDRREMISNDCEIRVEGQRMAIGLHCALEIADGATHVSDLLEHIRSRGRARRARSSASSAAADPRYPHVPSRRE